MCVLLITVLLTFLSSLQVKDHRFGSIHIWMLQPAIVRQSGDFPLIDHSVENRLDQLHLLRAKQLICVSQWMFKCVTWFVTGRSMKYELKTRRDEAHKKPRRWKKQKKKSCRKRKSWSKRSRNWSSWKNKHTELPIKRLIMKERIIQSP